MKTIKWSKQHNEDFGEDVISEAFVDGEKIGYVSAYRYCKPSQRTWDAVLYFRNDEKLMEIAHSLKDARKAFEEIYQSEQGE